MSPPYPPTIRPATPDEIAETLSHALRYDCRRCVHHADDMMARITAQRLISMSGVADGTTPVKTMKFPRLPSALRANLPEPALRVTQAFYSGPSPKRTSV